MHWDTPQVHLDGAAFSLLTTGATGTQTFTAKDGNVVAYSDPGDAKYQTLELTWRENGVEQRWYLSRSRLTVRLVGDRDANV